MLGVPVPGFGLSGSRGGGSGGRSGLWGWFTLSSASGVANLPTLAVFLLQILLSLSSTEPKVM